MKLDIKKTFKNPSDDWEAIRLLIEAQQDLSTAFSIMNSMLENNTEEFTESHTKMMKDFINKFKE